LAPEWRESIAALAASLPENPKPRGKRGRPKESGRHMLDMTYALWRAEALFLLETGRSWTAGEAIEIVADRHCVAPGTVRNNVGFLTEK
jgi:hypothetical protein